MVHCAHIVILGITIPICVLGICWYNFLLCCSDGNPTCYGKIDFGKLIDKNKSEPYFLINRTDWNGELYTVNQTDFWYYFEFNSGETNITGNYPVGENFYLWYHDSQIKELEIGNVYPIFYDDDETLKGARIAFNTSSAYIPDTPTLDYDIPVIFDYGLSISISVISGAVILVEVIILFVHFMSFIGKKIRTLHYIKSCNKQFEKEQFESATLESVTTKHDLFVLGMKMNA